MSFSHSLSNLSNELLEAELLLYLNACPNCGGLISDKRLKSGLPCSSCLPPEDSRNIKDLRDLYKALKKRGTLYKLREIYRFYEGFESLRKFFRKCVGNEPWSIQNLWLKRIAKGSSFAMIAPTGVGKTTFGLVVALYLAMKGHKSYIIVPTTTLAMQAEKRLEELALRANIITQPLVIHSKLKKREREAREEKLINGGDFDILVTTSNYLIRNYEKVLKHNFRFIFVDDVDSVLKGSKAINHLIKLAGYTEKDIERGLEAVRLKRELVFREDDVKLQERLRKIEEELRRKREKVKKILIIASATGNPRGIRVRLFRELMGFEIGARPEFIRNIEDIYKLLKGEEIKEAVLDAVKRLGSGGLVYVPKDQGIEFAVELADYLRKHEVSAEALHSKNVKAIDSFATGTIDVLVGVATYYGVLVRGIDLPEVIRYAIFAGVPRHKIGLDLKEIMAQDVIRLLPLIREAIKDEEIRRKIDNYNVRLSRLFRRGGQAVVKAFNELLAGSRTPSTKGEQLFLEAYKILKKLVSKPEVIEAIKENPNIAVKEEDGKIYVLIPDAATYIQASGRTSRLYLGGISKGISLLLVDDERLLRGLERRLKWILEDFSFKPLKDVNLNEVLQEVDRTRELIRLIRLGKAPKQALKKSPLQLKTALLVVESPNKARTIARFFGRPSSREYGKLKVYEVSLGSYTLLITATQGHVYDLATELPEGNKHLYGVVFRGDSDPRFIPVYDTIKKCVECGNQFVTPSLINGKPTCPKCGSPNFTDKKDIVEALRDVALEVDEVLVGTDPDTEGEKIAFDITNLISPYSKSISRVEFHEVTRKAIVNAINKPRDLNLDLVKAQLVRRIEDRWLGFSLSSRLQKEFWRSFCREVRESSEKSVLRKYLPLCERFKEEYRNLSAGRVQTPVLGWIIEAYDKHVRSRTYFLILKLGEFRLEIPLPDELRAALKKDRVIKVTAEVTLDKVSEETLNPLPPYTTDSALYDINSKLRIPTQTAMQLLQDLFELGFITYHRTDSTRVSDVGIGVAKDYLKELMGEEFRNYFIPRTWGEGGAHECIRPTRPIDAETLKALISEGVIEPVRRLRRPHFMVYDLIFRRFIASQSKAAKVKKVSGKIKVILHLSSGKTLSMDSRAFESFSEVLFDGFLKFYTYVQIRKPPAAGSHELSEGYFSIKEWYTEPLHTQATLVKMMRDREIGRPSTYAKIIDTLFKRKYVTHDKSRSKGIIPLPLGRKVYEYLTSNYTELVSEERTRDLERRMKEIETGSARYSEVLNELFEELKEANLIQEVA